MDDGHSTERAGGARAADYFAALGIGRRLVLDPAEIDTAFRTLSAPVHPDASGGRADPEAFAALVEARDVLRSTARRARHLAQLLGVPEGERGGGIDPADAELVAQAGSATASAESVCTAAEATTTALARSLLAPNVLSAKAEVEAAQGRIAEATAKVEEALAALDQALAPEATNTNTATATEVAAAADRLSFLETWQSRLGQTYARLLGCL